MYLFICVSCTFICMKVHKCVPHAHSRIHRLEENMVKLQRVVNCVMWVLGTEPRSSARSLRALNADPYFLLSILIIIVITIIIT